MKTSENKATLIKLRDTEFTVAHPDEDVRGFKVIEQNGEEIGVVEDLLIDGEEKKVRFLECGDGGLWGLGEQKFLVPIDSITSVDHENKKVHICHTKACVTASPKYNPDLKVQEDLEEVYAYYGYMPYWSMNYMLPIHWPFIRK
jgi:sporulation protein YlmC with PRC-barrel domain